MPLPSEPPKYASWSAMLAAIKLGSTGWPVYALQSVLNVTADGDFGPVTKAALVGWQQKKGLVDDGIAGPATQAKMLQLRAAAVEGRFPALPKGLLDGFSKYEGANILAATNWYTPDGGRAGVDCGPVQWRIYGPPFALVDLKEAFDPDSAFAYAAQAFSDRLSDYARRNPRLTTRQRVEAAVLAHNAPFLAEQIVRYGKLSTPDAIALWTTKPDGGHYTHAEWAVEYPSRILEGVTY